MSVGLKRGLGNSEYRHICVVNLRQGPQDCGYESVNHSSISTGYTDGNTQRMLIS